MTPEAARAAARRLLDERAARRPWRPVAEVLGPLDLDAAYDVADALVEAEVAAGLGPVAGAKIALTSPAMQALVGVDRPLAGTVLASRVLDSGALIPPDRFVHAGLECEVAVRLGADLPAADAPFDRERVAAAVHSCMPAFELVEDRGADYDLLDAVSLAAENAWNGANVLGPPVERDPAAWLDPAFAAAGTRLAIDGEPAGEGRVGDALGHPFEAVAWVASHLAARGRALAAGMIVMTGSTVVTRFPGPGQRCRFEVEGLGAVEVAFGG